MDAAELVAWLPPPMLPDETLAHRPGDEAELVLAATMPSAATVRGGLHPHREPSRHSWSVATIDTGGRAHIPDARRELRLRPGHRLDWEPESWGLTAHWGYLDPDPWVELHGRRYRPLHVDDRGRIVLPLVARAHLGLGPDGRVLVAVDPRDHLLLLISPGYATDALELP